ncbi:MAG: helix-turn-helix domain-containing protein [Promethearchaeota archaeon]
MESETQDDKIISALMKTGLNYEESLVYKSLINYGYKGTTVRKLNNALPIERTTIYSILKRLVEKGYVLELKSSETSNKVKSFISLEPSKFFEQILLKKIEDLKKFEEQRLIFTETMQDLYLKKRFITFENLDKFIRPYLEPLLKKKWEVYSQVVEKTFGVNIYEYQINSPSATRTIPYCVFNVYDFSDSFMKNFSLSEKFELDLSYLSDKLILEDLLNDANTNFIFYFYLKRINKRIKRDDLLNKYNMLDNFRIREIKEKLLGKHYPSLKFEAIPKKGTNYYELMNIVLIPLNNKLFSLWAESIDLMKAMYECILKIEKIN